jgi:hypothetical protein
VTASQLPRAATLDAEPSAIPKQAIVLWGRVYLAASVLIAASSLALDFRTALTMLNLLAFGGAVLGLGYPPLGLLGITMLCTLVALVAPLLLTGGLWRWNTLNYWLLIVMFLWSPYLLRSSDLSSRILQALILLLGLELLLSPEVMSGVQHLLTIVTMFGLVIYFARAASDSDTWFWVALVNATLALVVCAAFLHQTGRIPFVNPNVWPYVPLTAILLTCLAFPFQDRFPKRQTLLGVLAIANSCWVFLSGSRGALLVAIVSLVFLVLMAPNLKRSVVQFSIGALLVLGVLSQFADQENTTFKRIHLLFDPSRSARMRTSGRFDLVLGGWYIFQDHPMGVGTGGFGQSWAHLGRREGISNFKRGKDFPAHSAWIKILTENGIPGIILLVSYLLSFALTGLKRGTRRLRLLGFFTMAVLGFAWVSVEFFCKGLWLLAAGTTVVLNRRMPATRSPTR